MRGNGKNPMDDKDSFDEFMDRAKRDADIMYAVESCKDEDGNVDTVQATATTIGLGHSSDEDMAMLGSVLASEGAFDENNKTASDVKQTKYAAEDNSGCVDVIVSIFTGIILTLIIALLIKIFSCC